jgi:hypothetical protein
MLLWKEYYFLDRLVHRKTEKPTETARVGITT